MKKTKTKTKATKKSKGVPFTCVVKGAGIDINVKLDSVKGDLSGLTSAIRQAFYPPAPIVEIDLHEEIVAMISSLDGDELAAVRELITTEIVQRTQGNGAPVPVPSNQNPTAEA